MKLITRNRASLLVVLVICLLISLIGIASLRSDPAAPKADAGFIDLSNWDFNNTGVVKLDGYWEFYPNVLLTPKDFLGRSIPPHRFVEVPARWSNTDPEFYMPDQGVGTYRLQLKVDPSIGLYGLKTLNIKNSSVIYVNGNKVGNSGIPTQQMDGDYVSRNVPYMAFFPADQGNLDIIIQVANLDYYYGGIIQSISLGAQQDIVGLQFRADLLEAMGFSFLLLSGVYYFGIYIKRRHDRSFLYFAVFCLAYAFVIATYNEKIFMKLFTLIPYMWIFRVKVVIIGISLVSISLFIRELGESFLSRGFIRSVQLLAICFSFMAIITPTAQYAFLENAIIFIYLLLILVIAFNLIRAIWKKNYGRLNKNATIYLSGGIFLIILQFISTLLYISSIINNNLISIFTLLFFLIGIAAMFAEQYSRAYSELEIMSNRLIELDRAKDEFLINTSHEFKTPLHGIINIAQVIRDQNENIPNQNENLSYIISLATRLSTLVNDIIDYQSLQNQSLTFHNKNFDINGTVQATLDVLKYLRKSDEIQLINDIPIGEYFLFIDENRFKQILVNLVGNALKFTEQGTVKITADSRDGFVYITIADTGLGMDDENKNSLFIDGPIKSTASFTDSHSSGLGLKISKLLATQMGGDLYLLSSQENIGTAFEIVLPEAKAIEQKERLDTKKTNETSKLFQKRKLQPSFDLQKSNTNHVPKHRIKILLVDDEASNIKVLQELLADEKYETLVAYNGSNALKVLQEHRDISLVLLDVMMPGISGYEVCKQIRKEYPIYQLPILLLTVRYSSVDISTGLEAGANDYLVKPFDAKELMARVDTLLELKAAVENAIKLETLFLQSQIKPHFIYNVLSIVISLCYSDGPRAGKLLGEFSNYLRLSFDIDPYHSKVSLGREISLVRSYIELEQARFGERLHVDIDICDGAMEVPVPALIIQPLVENAIQHGLMKRISGGKVIVKVEMDTSRLQIMIEDNGVGISEEWLAAIFEANQHVGNIGLLNVHKRLVNEYGQGLQIVSQKGIGTKVTIVIPFREAKIKQVGDYRNESNNSR